METVAGFFALRGVVCETTREPGGTPIGGRIRSILLNPDHGELDARTELLLYMADRAQHLHQVILPALDAGRVVVCDRYVDATVVYQGTARKLDPAIVLSLHREVLGGLMPQLTLLLDLSPETGLRRAWRQIGSGERSAVESRFETEDLAFHREIRHAYLERARLEPERFRVLDASRSVASVSDDIRNLLASLYPHEGPPSR
jgi:dTMP kinase